MRKFIVIACIVSIAFFGLAYDSLSQGAYKLHLEDDIEGLNIDFGSNPLSVTLPVIGTLKVRSVEIVAYGREHLVIAKSGQYNYWAKLGQGDIYVTTEEHSENDPPQRIQMRSASISEHFNVQDSTSEDPNDMPLDSVNLYFKATLVLDGEQTFDFTLKLKSGQVQIIRP